MSVSRASTTSTTKISSPLTKPELTSQRIALGNQLKEVKNKSLQISGETAKLDQSTAACKSLVSVLSNISSQHGDSASVRVKDGNLKFGQGSNLLKNLFNGGRYQKERQAAAEKFGLQGNKTISVAEGKKSLQGVIEANTQKKRDLENTHRALNTQEKELKQTLADVDYELSTIDLAESKSFQDTERTSPTAATSRSSGVKETKVLSAKEKELRSTFSKIYQSNAGCIGINAESRHQFAGSQKPGQLGSGKVADEYIRVFGDNHFTGGNKEVLQTLKHYGTSVLPSLVKEAAESWYTPSEETIITHRGQGMTEEGIEKLKNDLNKNYTYSPGQFFSTSESKEIAANFAKNSSDTIKVIFEIKGNSSNQVVVRGGLSFGAAPKSKEREKLYSPLANFKIDDIKKDANGIHRVKMSEVAQVKKPKILPY